jgi:hypothetical protein
MLNPNVIVDIDDDVDNEIKIIPFVLEFGHASGSTIVVFLMIGHIVTFVFQETLI